MVYTLRRTAIFLRWQRSLADRRAALVIANRINRLAQGNFGDVKPVGEGVSELRIDYGPGYRVYFVRDGPAIYVLLCGGDKDSQKKDIRLALQLARDLKG